MDLMQRLIDNKEKIALMIGFVLVFSFGFFSGYFYLIEKNNESEKIVVKEPSDQCSSLFKASPVLPDPAKSDSYSVKIDSDSSKIAGEEGKGTFVASKNSKIFHKSDCSYVQSIKEENRIWFGSEKEAEDKGFSPHSFCFK